MSKSPHLGTVLVIAVVACTSPGETPTQSIPNPTFRSGPDAVVKIAGDGQLGVAGQPLAESFVVRVVDDVGNPVPDIRVVWIVVRGGGDVRPDTSETGPGGEAEARLMLGSELGKHSVQATAGSSSSISLTAVFEVRATVWPVRVRDFRFLGPRGTADAELSVGDTVRWTNEDTIPHAIRSVEVPADAAGFESSRLRPGESFEFAPSSAGEWRYRCSLHPDRTPAGTLRVGS